MSKKQKKLSNYGELVHKVSSSNNQLSYDSLFSDFETQMLLANQISGMTYGDALKTILQLTKTTKDRLAETAGIDASTLSTYTRKNNPATPSLSFAVAICIALGLAPPASIRLLNCAGYTLRNTPSDTAYAFLLYQIYPLGLEACNQILIDNKLKPLTNVRYSKE